MATLAANQTTGLVCAHHHLYSALARGMPAPPQVPRNFRDILEQIWWRLDTALDLEMLEWSAKLGALEALECGTTAIIDHHESPNAIEGSLDVLAAACAEVGVHFSGAYGVTDRHGPDGAARGLAENERYLRAGGRGMVGVHAAFTCSQATLEAAAGLAQDLGVGVHIHVAEGPDDVAAGARLAGLAQPNWLLVHAVHLADELPGTIVHNPRSNMNNSVGYAQPSRFNNPVVLGTDGIGADLLEEFRLAYARLREHDIAASPETPWTWLTGAAALMADVAEDVVTWSSGPMNPWHLAFSPGVRPTEVSVGGRTLVQDGHVLSVDATEIRAKAAEQAARLFGRL